MSCCLVANSTACRKLWSVYSVHGAIAVFATVPPSSRELHDVQIIPKITNNLYIVQMVLLNLSPSSLPPSGDYSHGVRIFVLN